ncbi:hypothetical protein [Paenibacillus sp. FSL H3-0333]|uniref:hypothetical protein n=1 Tax=Paenibacillus sp. FSL H3-0333 TaxID=2921373 RepID=UPI0030F67011
MTTELQQTRGSVKIEGKIVGFDKTQENSYRKGSTKESNKPYRSISLGVKTSPTNQIYQLNQFGMIPEKAAKVIKFKGRGNKEHFEIDYAHKSELPDGAGVMGFGIVGVGDGEQGKQTIKNYFAYDAVEKIADEYGNDDSVVINGEFDIDTYESNGESKTTVKYNVKKIWLAKEPIDFEKENYKEVASFEQEFVVVGHNLDKDAKKLYVTGRLITFKKDWYDITFTIDLVKHEALGQNIFKKTKFGDILKVQGIIVNGVVLVEAPVQTFDWGGEIPAGQQNVISNRISELQITNVLEHTPKVYKEDDFFKAAEFSTEDPWASSTSSKSTNSEDPFDKKEEFQW